MCKTFSFLISGFDGAQIPKFLTLTETLKRLRNGIEKDDFCNVIDDLGFTVFVFSVVIVEKAERGAEEGMTPM